MLKNKGLMVVVVMFTLFVSMATVGATEVEVKNDEPVRGREAKPEREAREEKDIAEIFSNLYTRFDERVKSSVEKRLEKVAKQEEKSEERFLRGQEKLAEIAPEYVEEFQEAYDKHNAVHRELFATNLERFSSFSTETVEGIKAMEATLLDAVQAGEMTNKEASFKIKEYMTTRKETLQQEKEAYKEAIAELHAKNETYKEAIKQLFATLKTAVENKDEEVVKSTLDEILVYKELHIEYDYAKLDFMKGMTE